VEQTQVLDTADLQPVVGRLVAVNVGLPQDVPWHGRTVYTGVWKYPVDGPRMVRTTNIDGDGQGDLGGHGGPNRAVMVYQLASYEHWRAELGRDDLGYGQFGENFTVEGLPDDEVCIGDRYEIGQAIFEVSQPRVTCYRVGMRMGEPRLPALLVSHRRPGFYLRVLREGIVAPGDPIVRIGQGPERMTVSDIDGLLYLPGHDRDALGRALRIDALSAGWKGSFSSMLAENSGASGNVGLTDAAGSPAPAWPGFRPMRVAATSFESQTVISVRLASADGSPLPPALPGQFIAIRVALDGPTHIATRSYSLSGAVQSPEYRVSVKCEPGGSVSRFLYSRLRAGDVVEVAAPRGRFILQDGDSPVLLISAGIGATPVLAMLNALAAQGSDRQVWWLYGARSSAEHPFADEVRGLLARLPNTKFEICYSAPLPTDQLGVDYSHRGRLNADLLTGLGLPPDGVAYVCGPTVFMADIRSALVDLGLDDRQVRTEVFGAGPAITPGIAASPILRPHPPAGAPGTGPAVTFVRSGLTVPWRDDVSSLLELAEACDVPAQWSCRTGVCHTCEVGLLTGSVAYNPPPIDLPATGNVLICCSAPRDELAVDL
jgi:ferredoxin-NADP reductase/MOSC domain-containing protein YiiM/ferredoxin